MKERFAAVRILALDVDGVLTDGSMIYGPDDEQIKVFSAHDGLGIRLAREAGLEVVIVTGNSSKAVEHRAKHLGFSGIFQMARYKADAIKEICARWGVSAHEVAFIGDDLNDLPAFDSGCLAIAVANATDEVKSRAAYVTSKKGGAGAIREVIELVLKSQNRWEEAVQSFLDMLRREQEEGARKPVA